MIEFTEEKTIIDQKYFTKLENDVFNFAVTELRVRFLDLNNIFSQKLREECTLYTECICIGADHFSYENSLLALLSDELFDKFGLKVLSRQESIDKLNAFLNHHVCEGK